MLENRSDGRVEKELSLEWKQSITDGIEMTLENFELFETAITFDPISLTEGKDERVFDQLNGSERLWINRELFRIYSIRLDNAKFVDGYQFSAPEEASWKGVAKVRILEILRSKLENLYLHEITRPGTKEVEYMIATKDFRL